MKATIIIKDGENIRYSITDNDCISLGRDQANDISFKEYSTVSRKHALLKNNNGRLFIISFGKNGTFINRALIRNNNSIELDAGDEIRLAPNGPIIVVKNLTKPAVKPKSPKILIPIIAMAIILLFIPLGFWLSSKKDLEANRATLNTVSSQLLKQEYKTKSLESELLELKLKEKKLFEHFDEQIAKILESAPYAKEYNSNYSLPVKIDKSVFLLASANYYNRITSYGTSFPIDNSGLLCTNYHVITGAYNIYTKLNNNYYPLEVVYTNPEKDIALLRGNIQTYPLKLRIPTQNDIGRIVYVIGFPWASITGDSPTVTKGILSGFTQNNSHIITDAPINKGNSGGPLLDQNCYVIGVNTFIIREDDIEGAGFAINIAPIIDLRRSYGR